MEDRKRKEEEERRKIILGGSLRSLRNNTPYTVVEEYGVLLLG